MSYLSSFTVCLDSISEAAGHVAVASPLVNLMKDQVDKLARLGIVDSAASLNDISEENARGVRAECLSNEKISFRLLTLISCPIGGLFAPCCFFSVGDKNRLETVTQRWKTCAGLAPRRLRYTTTRKGVLATKILTITRTLKK